MKKTELHIGYCDTCNYKFLSIMEFPCKICVGTVKRTHYVPDLANYVAVNYKIHVEDESC